MLAARVEQLRREWQQRAAALPLGDGPWRINRAFDSTAKVFVNQTTVLGDSGQELVFTGEVKDAAQPFRVTLCWTDAPGFSGAAPWVSGWNR